jgi:hypothetical protein
MFSAGSTAFASFPASGTLLTALLAPACAGSTGSALRTILTAPPRSSTLARSSPAFGSGGFGLFFGFGFLFGCGLRSCFEPGGILAGLLLFGGFQHGCYRLGRVCLGSFCSSRRLGGSAAFIR